MQRAFLLHLRRFSEWRDSLRISDPVLANRIAEMVAAGLLVPTPYRDGGRTRTEYLLSAKAIERLARFTELDVLAQALDGHGRDEYRLTEKGIDFFPIYAFLTNWARRWYAEPAGGGMVITHQKCGRRLVPGLYCGSCGRVLAREAVHFELPGGLG